MQPQDAAITGGTVLRIPAIQSPNYVAGVSGWIIKIDGSAEFNNLTIRGQFFGTDFIINSSGIFLYSGAPANGNLSISIAPSAGTDSFGNSYPTGLSVGQSGQPGVVVGTFGSGGLIYFTSTTANVLNDASLQLITNGAGNAAHDTLVIRSDEDATQLDTIAINLDGSSKDGTALAQIRQAYVDSAGTAHFYFSLGFAGAALIGSTTAVQPGTGTSRSNTAVAETWHTATLTGNWTGSGNGVNGLAYRVTSDNELHIVADLTVPAAPGNIFTFGAGYIPATAGQNIPCGSYANNVSPHASISNTGVLTATALGAAGTALVINARIPLDAV